MSNQTEVRSHTETLDISLTLKRLAEIESMIGLMKKLYEEKDQLVAKLHAVIGLNQEVSESDFIFSVVDNFSTGNIVFRPAAVRRFDLKVDSHFARKLKEDKASKKVKAGNV